MKQIINGQPQAIRMAIIGYGGMGGWHHSSVKERVPEVEVTGACDVREEAREKARSQGLYAYETLQELLDDPAIELVTVAVPNNFHKPLVIACLEAGKNVICEKPVALNAAEMEEMMAAAKRCGKVFSVHQNRRWDKDYQIVKKAVADGMIGTPYFFESRVQGSRGAVYGWRGHKENGGGMVLDWCAHLVDQMLMMIDSPVISVYAHLMELFSEVDDNVQVMLRFENGIMARLEVLTNCFINQSRWHVSGSGGTLQINDWDCSGKIVKAREGTELEWTNDIVYTEAGPTRTMAPRPKIMTEEVDLPDVSTDWSDYYRNIAKVIRGEEELLVKPEQVLRNMRVIDAIFESQEQKKSITVRI